MVEIKLRKRHVSIITGDILKKNSVDFIAFDSIDKTKQRVTVASNVNNHYHVTLRHAHFADLVHRVKLTSTLQ